MDQSITSTMIQVLPLPRQLPRVVIWSIYSVTWLGLIVAIVVVLLLYDHRRPLDSDRQEPPRELPQQHDNHTQQRRLLFNNKLGNDSSMEKKRRQQSSSSSSSQRQTRSGFVTLEEVVAYECHFQAVYQNTTWLDGSDTEIKYLDVFGQPRVMNVGLEQSRDSRETSNERRIVKNLTWVAKNDDATKMPSDPSYFHIVWNCSDNELCKIFRNICPTRSQQLYIWIFQRKYMISVWDRCPWFLLDWMYDFTFIPHSRRWDVNLLLQLLPEHHNTNAASVASISKVNELWQWSRIRRKSRDARELKELEESSLHHDNDKVHVTKMILEAGKTFFVAAPISNVSLRFLYGGEPPRCLTCPEGGGADGDALECLSSDAMLSTNARYYILYCRGSEVPWTAVVSTRNNRIVYRLNNQENSREWYASRPRPVIRELEVKLNGGKHTARVRLHLPFDWQDKTSPEDKCIYRLRLLLRIADEQQDQMVNAQFDFSLTNYLTTVKGYAVVYADVRGSQFQSFDFRYLRFRRRELMQMTDYARVVAYILTHFECIENQVIGVYGENYGGHMALNLVADNDEERNINSDNKFRCAVTVNPLAKWHDYIYPFTVEHTSGVTGALRKKMFKRYYMAALVNRLRGKNFALHTSRPSNEHRYYTNTLLKMLKHHAVKFEHHHYEDESVKMCNSKLVSYKQASDFFDRCFGREINND